MVARRDKVGNIRILELIGEGGMGDVYVGFDEKLERRVALKAIRRDQLDHESRARLLAEARVLSQLDHRHICRIYDYQEHGDEHFLVLELIQGRELRDALGDLDLDARRRVAEEVASALIAAHDQGVIHRDLKPANVMLDTEERVKVLDFGLARFQGRAAEEEEASTGDLTAGVSSYVKTQFGVLVGTAESMSPEQARGESATAASDVYSFGLLLQELFTGRPPYEPGLPVALLVTKAAEGDTLPIEGLGPDLTRLIERMLSLSPSARPSAREVAETLRQIREKPARRMRRLAALALVFTFLAGGIKYTYDLRESTAAAIAARNEAEQVVELLVDLFEVSDPSRVEDRGLDPRELLDRGAESVRRDFEGEAGTRARLLDTIGLLYTKLGLYERAQPLLEEALALRRELRPPEPLEVATSLQHLGDLAYYQRREESEAFYSEALALREEHLGTEHPDVAASVYGLGSFYARSGDLERGEELFTRSLEIRERTLGPEAPEVGESLKNLAGILLYRGQPEAAEGHLQRALGILKKHLGEEHAKVGEIAEGLAVLYAEQERPGESERYHLQALRIWEEAYGPEHPNVGLVLSNLGNVLRQLDRPAEAEARYREAMKIREASLPPGHVSLGYTGLGLARALRDQGRLEEAETELQTVLGILEESLGPENKYVLSARRDLAQILRDLGRPDEADEVDPGPAEEAS